MGKKFIITLCVFVFGILGLQAQTVTGTVLDTDGFAIPEVQVSVEGSTQSTSTDENGNFSLQVPAGNGVVQVFTAAGVKAFPYNVAAGATQNFGDITLEPTLQEVVAIGTGVIDIEEDRQTPVAVSTVFKDEIQEKAQGNVEFPEVLKNTPSVFVSGQPGGFGDSQMFTRGFDQTNTAFLLNGQPINGMEDGKMYWSNWSGMTDIANAVQIQRGLGSSKLAISSVGGTINIITKATEKKQGGYLQAVAGNDSYFKVGAGYNTGLKGKWGLSIALSHWQGNRKWAQGTRGAGESYFLSVGFKPSDRHTLNFLVTGAPQWHDQNFSKSLADYKKYGIKYNNNFGFQGDEYKTERRNYYHKPVFNLNWDFSINDRMNLSSVMYASVGRGGGTGRFGSSIRSDANGLKDFTFAHARNLLDPDLLGGNGGSNSAIRGSVNNHFWWGNVTNFNMKINDNLSFNVGGDFRSYHGDHFREFVDLLGLSGWYADNDVRNDPNYVVSSTFKANPWTALTKFAKEGQRISYDYSEDIQYIGGFGQIEYASDRFSIFAQGSISNQNYQREDRWNSKAKSPKVGKSGYNIKGGAAYNITSEHALFFNAGTYSRQPFLDNIFSSTITLRSPEVKNETITGLEGGYKWYSKRFNLNVNYYNTTWSNRFLTVFSQQDPGFGGQDVSYLYTNIEEKHSGIEVDFNASPTSKFDINTYFTFGYWRYTGSSPYDVRADSDFSIIGSGTQKLAGIKIGNAPQVTFGLGGKYRFTNAFSMDANMNYYGALYGEVSPNSAINGLQSEQLKPYVLFDAGLTYKLKLGKQSLKLRANAYNLFDVTYVANKDAYGYFYGQGATYNIGVTANFK